MRRIRTVDPAAHEEYLRGRYAESRFDVGSFEEALRHFQAATRIDSTDAASWAGVAGAYYLVSNMVMRPDVAMPRAREAAERAIRLDPDLDEAHTWLATVLAQYDWNWPAAEREFQRAITLNPNSSSAHIGYAILLQECARPDESIREGERAREVDPLSGIAAAYCGWSYYCAGRFPEALDRYRRIVAEDSTNSGARYGVGICLVEMGRVGEGIAVLERAVLGAPNGYPIACLGYAYARGGRIADARRVLAQLAHPPNGVYVSPLWSAYVYSALGERDRAFDCIDRSFEHHDEDLGWLKVEPRLRDLRGDSRFAAALRRLHLPA
jgi:serine/threonine-protein kinase